MFYGRATQSLDSLGRAAPVEIISAFAHIYLCTCVMCVTKLLQSPEELLEQVLDELYHRGLRVTN